MVNKKLTGLVGQRCTRKMISFLLGIVEFQMECSFSLILPLKLENIGYEISAFTNYLTLDQVTLQYQT